MEVKGDNPIEDSIILARQQFAEQIADASGLTHHNIKGSDAQKGSYTFLFNCEPYVEQGRLQKPAKTLIRCFKMPRMIPNVHDTN